MSLGDAMRLARRKFLHLAAGSAALPYLPRTAFAEDAYRGIGQRILATDTGETPFLELRTLSFGEDAASADGLADPDHA